MEWAKAKAIIESVLFAMGETVEISKLADLIEEDVRTTKKILAEMGKAMLLKKGELNWPSLTPLCSSARKQNIMNI